MTSTCEQEIEMLIFNLQIHPFLLLSCLRVLAGERRRRAAPPPLRDLLLRVPRLHDRLLGRCCITGLHRALRPVEDVVF